MRQDKLNNSLTARTFLPPVMEARRWLDEVNVSEQRSFINVSQAAPVDPPPAEMRQMIAETVLNSADAHHYGPVLGLPELRESLAAKWSHAYTGYIRSDQVAITSGCNQAFCTAISLLANERSNIILPSPYYFNHVMWLEMQGIEIRTLISEEEIIPSSIQATELIDENTVAIVLVTPNNPGGVEYPADLIRRMYDISKSNGIALIIDETYRDFRSHNDSPHDLFTDPDWSKTLIHLYSFSKAFRLTGHRVGALVASSSLLTEAEKFLDTVTICPNQIGQRAALWGLCHLDDWLKMERNDILDRQRAINEGFITLAQEGWSLLGIGAYFAYVRHPFALNARDLARRLVHDAGILLLPGTMFRSRNCELGQRELRIAFANLDCAGISQLFERLQLFGRHASDILA